MKWAWVLAYITGTRRVKKLRRLETALFLEKDDLPRGSARRWWVGQTAEQNSPDPGKTRRFSAKLAVIFRSGYLDLLSSSCGYVLSVAGTENPCVGGSIPSLATMKSIG